MNAMAPAVRIFQVENRGSDAAGCAVAEALSAVDAAPLGTPVLAQCIFDAVNTGIKIDDAAEATVSSATVADMSDGPQVIGLNPLTLNEIDFYGGMIIKEDIRSHASLSDLRSYFSKLFA